MKQFQHAIDAFIQERMRRAAPDQSHLLQFVLDGTRRHVEEILRTHVTHVTHVGTDFSLEKLDELCDAFDAAPTTYDIAVLESVGAPELHHEIIACRYKVKWDILVVQLRLVIPDDGSQFSPATIQRLDTGLGKALRAALKREAQTDEFDWELLKEKLPEDLANRYEAKKLPLAERRAEVEEDTKALIGKLGLTEAVASLGSDPKKLRYFLQISGLDLNDQQIDRIVYVSFAGLRETQSETKYERLIKDYRESLGNIAITGDIPPRTTGVDHVTLTVIVPRGSKRLLVRGPWKRDIKINGEVAVTFDVVLQPGEFNEIKLLAYDDKKKVRSAPEIITIKQTSKPTDIDELVQFLESLRDDTLDAISQDKARAELFRRCVEESALRHFASNFEQGIAYLDKLGESQKHGFVQRVIREIKKRFTDINTIKFPFMREGRDLMFFQKYCVFLIEEKRRSGDTSVILANEPGLGKTVTAQVATVDDEVLAVVPNSAASTWVEQEAMFFNEPFLVNLARNARAARLQMLEECDTRGVLTNVEFVRHDAEKQDGGTQERKFKLLNKRRKKERQRVTILDEAHFLKNDSQQTAGISQLKDDFMLLLTASPYRNPSSLCRVMAKLKPDDPRFISVKAFLRAFPPNDPRALKALHLLVQPHVIRFLKSEVMPTYDQSRPVEEQPLFLPAKKHIDPFKTGTGLFMLTPAQEEAILEMFTDWRGWTEKYERYMPSGDLAVADGIRTSDNQLTKQHALRQIVNNPAYIKSYRPSPKHKAAMDIVDSEMSSGNKVLIFCRYHEQVKAYARLLQERGIEFCMYTGEISDQGNKKDTDGREMLFAIDEFDNYRFDAHGEPIQAETGQRGKEMLAMDYERLAFQNSAGKKVMLATYSAGSQSVTFTAATAMIFDDLPKDYTEQYQAEDRSHRIDAERRNKEVRYYSLVSRYSDEFLARMRERMTKKHTGRNGDTVDVSAFDRWFAQGTLDQVHHSNLAAQRTSFELMNNGIAADPELIEAERPFAM